MLSFTEKALRYCKMDLYTQCVNILQCTDCYRQLQNTMVKISHNYDLRVIRGIVL